MIYHMVIWLEQSDEDVKQRVVSYYVLFCLQPIGDESCAREVRVCGQRPGSSKVMQK